MPLDIPLLDLHAQYAPLRDEILAAIARVADRQRFIMGEEVAALERDLAGKFRVAHAIAVSSGTDALLVALMALGIEAGDEVITTAYSFFATAGTIARLGARPVFVDIDPATYNIDPEGVARAVTPRTKAILPVHLFGLAADLDSLTAIANEAGVPLVEDAAQAVGATYKGRVVGSVGALGCFSFYPTKNLGAFGDAGLVTTNDNALADRVRLLRQHGASGGYYHELVGGNFRMDEIQAAVLRVKAPHLEGWSEGRRRNAEQYRTLFARAGLLDAVTVPIEPADRRHIYNQFVLRTPRRDELRAFLRSRGVGTEIYYPHPFHLQPCFANLGYRRGAFPDAERAAAESMALPIYPELQPAELEQVVATIAEFVKSPVTASR
jgi:dTDP-4-amino-4,6-dideoxygalactose transaminase